MYLEEEMQGQTMTQEERRRWIYFSSRLDHLLTEQQQMAGRLAALESPIQAFEDQPALVEAMRKNRDRLSDELVQMREDYAALANEHEDLKQAHRQLLDHYADACQKLQMMQAGYNAIATIQARLDANEQEIKEGHRCCTG